jgi:DNA-binding response OmpR family regulator
MVNFNREKKRILFVDDDEDNWELVAFNLAECVVVCARDFNEGVQLARGGYFDLYLLDNWLPDGTGVELSRAIREFDPYTPVLFYSAAAYDCDKKKASRAGAQAYLVKPVHPNELSRVVTSLISATSKSVFEARMAEKAAIREELTIRQTESFERIERAKKENLHARVKAIRLRAEMAFLEAGGTRGAFAREWLPVFLEEVCGADTSDTASDN